MGEFVKRCDSGDVYREKSSGPRTEPWGTPVPVGDGRVV